jgi:hypothetical protein
VKLYKISQTVNNEYDTYDSAVVAAEDEEEARHVRMDTCYYLGDTLYMKLNDGTEVEQSEWDWAHPKDVQVQYIGEAAPTIVAGVIVASFNAG